MALSVPQVDDQRVQQALNSIATSFPLTTQLLVDEVITTTKIVDGSITAEKVAAEAIQAGHIEAGTITATQIKAATITGDKIAANTITATNIAANTITAEEIEAGSITVDELDVDELSAITADLGTITAGSLDAVTITGTTITGGTLQTAAEGARVVIDSDGIRGINASAKEQFDFDTTTGILTATAVISSLAGSEIDTEHLAGQITETQIEDDSISTPKLQANIIEGKHLAVETLGALKADLGTITAGTLTGVTFQTSAEAPRVYMDSEGFHVENGEGDEALTISEDIFAFPMTDSNVGPREQIIAWLDEAGEPQVEIFGWDNSYPSLRMYTNREFEYDDSLIELEATAKGGGASLIIDGNVVGRYVKAGAGVKSVFIINSEDQSDFLQLPSTAKREAMWGTVNASGTKIRGSAGWTSSKVATGTYKITFTEERDEIVSPTFSTFETSNTTPLRVKAATKTYFEIYTKESGGKNLDDSAFTFQVMA